MHYRRLRAPSKHGEILQLPPLNGAKQIWRTNLEHVQTMSQVRFGDVGLASLQESGRREVIKLAAQYTSDYLDVDLRERSEDQIVMSGHQPELFHPGVWFKNFALSRLGKQFNCIAINLVVDNDICGSAAIRYPAISEEPSSASVGTIPLVAPGPNVPFENRRIDDLNFFRSFPQRVQSAISPLVKDPLVHRFWGQLDSVSGQIERKRLLGQAIAMGRHRLEHELGLRTLEVPLSQISGSESFAIFAKSIFADAERFQGIYNESIAAYRRVHKIRSSAHPVPELISDEGWWESPFWVWHRDRPQRKRLFVKLAPTSISLTDREGWESTIQLGDFVEQFCGLKDDGVSVRPRALITTMHCRLVLSDLFIHGIGGTKYDQLTDVIASQFFGAEPPSIMTISATMRIRNDFDLPDRADLVALRQLRRQIEFHPETMIESKTEETQAFVESKQKWISGEGSPSRARHLAINQANQQLQQFTSLSLAEISRRIAATAGDLRKSAVLNSREYSLALFPESLLEELVAMAE